MPLFVVHALDKAGSGPEIRAANRAAHLEWAAALGDKLKVGGPLLSHDGEQMIGSMLVIEYDAIGPLKEHLKTDPYAVAGLFERVDVNTYKWLIGGGRPAN